MLLYPNSGSFKLVPIDHSFTFCTLEFENLNPEHIGFSYNDSILFSPFGKVAIQRIKEEDNWLESIRLNFNRILSDIQADFREILDHLPDSYRLIDDEIDKLESFLFNKGRNREVFSLFRDIIVDISRQ